MTAILRPGGTVSGSGGSSSAAGTIPAAIVAGDLMILVVSFKAATGGASITTPTGWTPLGPAVNMTGGTGQARAYQRRSDGTDGGTTLTVVGTGATQQIDWGLAGYSQSGGVRSFAWADQGVTAATAIGCAASTTAPDDLVLAIAATRGSVNGGYSYTAPSGGNVDIQVTSTATAQDMGAVICSGAAAGAQTITASIAVWAIAGQVVLAGSLVPTPARPARRLPPQRRGRSTNVPLDTTPTPQTTRPARRRPPTVRRGSCTPAPPIPLAPVLGVYVPSSGRRRLAPPPPIRRTRGASVPVVAPRPPQPAPPRRRRPPIVPRRRGGQVPLGQPTAPPNARPARRGIWALLDWSRRRPRSTGVPSPISVTPVPTGDIPFETDPPQLRWQVGALSTRYLTDGPTVSQLPANAPLVLSVLTSEYIEVKVTLRDSDDDPTGDDVFMAFVIGDADPAGGDWVTGSWRVGPSGSPYARALVGPGGKVLTPGTYQAWLRFVDNPEAPARRVGYLVMQ